MGTRPPRTLKNILKQDHPHAYGDKFPIVRRISKGLGSSPRVWGQDDNNGKLTVANRIIPTRMGTSTS